MNWHPHGVIMPTAVTATYPIPDGYQWEGRNPTRVWTATGTDLTLTVPLSTTVIARVEPLGDISWQS